MNKIVSFCIAALLVLTVSACSKGDAEIAWTKVNQGALLVDVRTLGEFNEGHLPGAKLIPVSELENRLAELGDDKNRPIVVYCKSGIRSGRAEELLEAKGFTDVTNGGGYMAMKSVKP